MRVKAQIKKHLKLEMFNIKNTNINYYKNILVTYCKTKFLLLLNFNKKGRIIELPFFVTHYIPNLINILTKSVKIRNPILIQYL